MNKTIRTLVLGIVLTAAASQVHAQFSYSTDFSSTNYQRGFALPQASSPTNQNGWYVNPVSADTNSVLAAVISSNGGPTNKSYLDVGGSFLKAANSAPAANLIFAQKDTLLNTNSVRFQTAFYINPSSIGSSDTFGWTILNTAGNSLISIDLNYASGTNYTLGVTSYANNTPTNANGPVSQTLNATNGSPLSPINSSVQYNFAFNIYNIGTTNQSVSAFSYNSGTNGPPLFLGSTSIAGTDFSTSSFNNGDTNVASFAAYWSTANTNTFGNNYLAMANVTVATVPEPKTWILFGLSGLVLVVVLRRRAA